MTNDIKVEWKIRGWAETGVAWDGNGKHKYVQKNCIHVWKCHNEIHYVWLIYANKTEFPRCNWWVTQQLHIQDFNKVPNNSAGYLHHFVLPPKLHWVIKFSLQLSQHLMLLPIYFSHFDRNAVVLHCGFTPHIPSG